ncbi:unnamed protein product, partial [Mesorhabditis spiculigera]
MMSHMLHCRARRQTIEKSRLSTDDEPAGLFVTLPRRFDSSDSSTPSSPTSAMIASPLSPAVRFFSGSSSSPFACATSGYGPALGHHLGETTATSFFESASNVLSKQ